MKDIEFYKREYLLRNIDYITLLKFKKRFGLSTAKKSQNMVIIEEKFLGRKVRSPRDKTEGIIVAVAHSTSHGFSRFCALVEYQYIDDETKKKGFFYAEQFIVDMIFVD